MTMSSVDAECYMWMHCIFLAVSQPGIPIATMPTGTECPVLQKNCVVVDVVVIVAVIIPRVTIVHVWE